jgi:hypothetical protein
MRHTRVFSFLVALLLLASIAVAQTGDWQAVKHLPGGTMLKIKLKHGRTFGHCEFVGATDDALDCDYGGLLLDIRPRYRRDNIKAVYLVHNARAIGFGIGAGAGAVIGAAATPGSAAGRELFALIDAGLLGGLGYFFGMVADPFFHGKAVYRSLNSPHDANRPSIEKVESISKPAKSVGCLRDGVTLQCVTSESVPVSQTAPANEP